MYTHLTGLGGFIKTFVKRNWIIITTAQFTNNIFQEYDAVAKLMRYVILVRFIWKSLAIWLSENITANRSLHLPTEKADMSDKTHLHAQNIFTFLFLAEESVKGLFSLFLINWWSTSRRLCKRLVKSDFLFQGRLYYYYSYYCYCQYQ